MRAARTILVRMDSDNLASESREMKQGEHSILCHVYNITAGRRTPRQVMPPEQLITERSALYFCIMSWTNSLSAHRLAVIKHEGDVEI